MFRKKFTVELSRVIIYAFVAALVYPISAVINNSLLPAADAAVTATATSTTSNLWVNSAESATATTNVSTTNSTTQWTQIVPSSIDDGFSEVISKDQTCVSAAANCKATDSNWSFNFAGVTYSKVFFSSNNYITFGGGLGSIPTYINSLNRPGLMLCGADRYVSKQYYMLDGSGNLHLRMEGYDFQSSFAATPAIYEITLISGTSTINVAVGLFTPSPTSNRPCYYGSPATGANTSAGLMDSTNPGTTANTLLQAFPTGASLQYTSTIFTTSNGPTLTSSGGTTVSTDVNVTLVDTITVAGGQGATTVTMDTPTTGASFDSQTGVFRLTRSDSATVTQTFTARDSVGATNTLSVTFVVNALPTSTQSNSTLTTTLGRTGQETMTVAGGTAPFRFVKTSSNQQSGITIETPTARSAVLKVAATGVVAGTTTETITCTDAVGSVTVAVFTVVINPAMTLQNSRGYFMGATVGTVFTETITASGGTTPRSFALSGTLTSGNIYLDTSTASSGYVLLKTLSALQAGTYYETVTATDTRSATATLGMKLTVSAAAVIAGGATSSTVLATGILTYDTLTVTGGSLPLSYSLSVSPANSGISIFSSSNTQIVLKYLETVVSGTYSLNITATDSATAIVTHVRTLVASSPLRWDTSTATTMSVTYGTAGSTPIKVTNGFNGKAFTLTQISGSSTGITLDTSTASSGYASLKTSVTVPVGTYVESITATDVTGVKISILVTIYVATPPLIKSSSTLLAGNFGSLLYDGTTQYSKFTTGTEMALGTTYTIEWWQYQTDTHVYPRVFYGGAVSNGFALSLEGYNGVAGDNFFFWTGGTSHNLGSASTSRKNAWMHYAIVVNNNKAIAYENGKALKSTAETVETITSTIFTTGSQLCLAAKCQVSSADEVFSGNITNFVISTRADYSGTDTVNPNFTPTTSMNLDTSTVLAIAPFSGDTKYIDFSSYARSGTYTGSPTSSTRYPSQLITISATQGSAYTTPIYVASNGTGDKVFSLTNNNSGISISPSLNQATITLANTLTSLNSTSARTLYETITATDSATSAVKLPFKFLINPSISLSATSTSPQTSVGVALYDTITATYGTGIKTFSVSSSEVNSGISFSNPAQNTYVLKADATVPQGTYYETITATDGAGATSTLLITLTVNPPLSLVSATGSSSITTTAGKATSLRLNSNDGVAPKTYTLTHIGTARAGITLDTSTAPAYATLNIGTNVQPGNYSESVTVRDSSGASASILISVTVNDTPTISYNGATSGSITLTTTAGAALTSSAFTAALGTGTRTLSLSGLNTAITIDTSTSNTAYVTAGSSLTATNSNTAKSYYETMTVTDSLTATAIRAFTVVVNPVAVLSASSSSLTTTAGVSVLDTITATLGTGNKSFAITSSPSIAGITNTTNVANQTTLTIPNTVGAGTYTITITATDSVGATSSINVTLTVNSGVTITGPAQIGTVELIAGSTSTFNAYNGSGSYTFSLTPPYTGISIETKTATTFILKWTNVLTAVNSSTARTIYETVTATDSYGGTTSFPISISVTPKVVLSGTINVTKIYGTTFTSGYTSTGSAPFTYLGSPICSSEKSTFVGDGTNGTTLGVSYTVEKFGSTGSCTWVTPESVTAVSVLTVAGGGGGGGGGWAGGGGAGGVVNVSSYTVSSKQNIPIVVGSGGSGGTTDTTCSSGSSPSKGSNGTNSSFNGTFTANGGGGGGGYGWSSRNGCGSGIAGGSGGGSGEVDYTPTVAASNQPTYAGATSYGNSGGITAYLSGIQAGSGGGGASQAGASTNTSSRDHVAGKGGDGVALTITGSSVTYAGGGGGATCDGTCSPAGTGGAGGSGGGGRGQAGSNSAQNGTDGLGGGGGGGQGTNGGRGGNGVVIVRYATPANSTLDTITLTTDPTGLVSMNIPEFVPAGTYTQTITAKDSAGTTASATINITISKATPSVVLSLPGGGTSATYGTPVVITATAATRGTVTFKKGGSDISGCVGAITSGGTTTCTWTPTDTSTATITAAFTPTDTNNYNSTTSSNFVISILQADTLTVTFANQTLTYSESGTAVSRAFTLSGLASIDTVTSVATAITGTANDLTSVNITGSATNGSAGTSTVTKAGTFSLSGTSITFSGNTKASYYKAISYNPGTITVNRAGNSITLNYGAANTVTYKPTGTETATVTFKGTGSKNFSTTTSTYCSVDSLTGALTTNRAGSCDVAVSIAESPNFLGDTVTATVTINRALRTIALSSSTTTLKYGDTATVTTSISNAQTDGAISYSTGSSTGCTFDNLANLITATSGTTTCALVAKIATGTNYESATSTSLNITLAKANGPVLTLMPPSTINYSPSATSATMPLPTFSITGLKLTDTLTAASGIIINYVATGTYAYNSTNVPTEANVYSLTPTAITLTSGSMSNYNTPTYSSVNWTINRINQETLTVKSLFQEGITVPYDIQYSGGSTGGTVTGQIISGGTATSCTFVGRNLRANSTGTCFIRLQMAGNQNYLDVLSDTYTVLIANFKQNIFNFDSLAQGPGGITITSQVPVTKGADACSSNCQPKITGVSSISIFIGDPLTITGENFATATEVIFNLDSSVTSFQIDNGGTTITVIVPADVEPGTGGINVRSPQGLSPMYLGMTFKATNVVG